MIWIAGVLLYLLFVCFVSLMCRGVALADRIEVTGPTPPAPAPRVEASTDEDDFVRCLVNHPLDWPRALHPRRTPCRVDESKGVHQHPCSTEHRDTVQGYRSWREYEEQAAEQVTIGYDTEAEDYWRDRQRPTFRAYLEGMRS